MKNGKTYFIIVSIIVILISSLSVVSGETTESFQKEPIWMYSGEHNLQNSKKLNLGDYTLKLDDIKRARNTTISFVVYSDNRYDGKFTVNYHENRTYVHGDDLKIKVNDVNRNSINFSSYNLVNTKIWHESKVGNEMSEKEKLVDGRYTIKVEDINENFAELRVFDSQTGKSYVDDYKSGSVNMYNDEIYVRLADINRENDTLSLETYKMGKTDLAIDVLNPKTNINPNQSVRYDVRVKNTGDVPVHNVVLDNSVKGGDVGSSTINLNSMEKNQSTIFPVHIDPVSEPSGTSLDAKFTVTGEDYQGNKLSNSTNTSAYVNSYVKIDKNVSRNDISLSKGHGNGTFNVTLKVHNMADSEKTLKINDQVPESFSVVSDDSLSNKVKLGPDTKGKMEYTIKPTKVGEFRLKPAKVTWNDGDKRYTEKSDEYNVSVHGSWVQVKKTLNSGVVNVSDSVNVTIDIKNAGDREANITFDDTIPDGINMVSGQKSWNGKLSSGESRQFTYELKSNNSGEYELPKTKVIVNNKTQATSNSPILRVGVSDNMSDVHVSGLSRIEVARLMVSYVGLVFTIMCSVIFFAVVMTIKKMKK